jgi:hypothetical protein
MKICTRIGILVAILAIAASPSSRAQSRSGLAEKNKAIDNNVGDHAKFQHVMTDLQQAVADRNARAVAALVHYPITVRAHGRPFVISTPREFISSYNRIITPALAKIIESQRYEDLFVNYRGAMFGNGELWIVGYCIDQNCKQTNIQVGSIQTTSLKR